MSQSGQLKENQGTSKIVLKLTMVLMQLPPNAERPPGRKVEKAVRNRADSDVDPFIEEIKK
jgi:hypothetical protein